MSNNKKKKKNGKVIKLTQEGVEELKAELSVLVDEKLPEVVKRVAKAREHGDLSENSEYKGAREDKDFIDARIAEIEDILSRAKIVKKSTNKVTVGMGSKVKVHKKGDSKTKHTFTIVGEYEADPQEGKVSSVSPIGEALMNSKKGDEVTVEAPAGNMVYVIDEVK